MEQPVRDVKITSLDRLLHYGFHKLRHRDVTFALVAP